MVFISIFNVARYKGYFDTQCRWQLNWIRGMDVYTIRHAMSKKMKVKHLYTILQGNVGGATPNSLRACLQVKNCTRAMGSSRNGIT